MADIMDDRMRDHDFRGKSLFVAGGTSGINLAIATEAARLGARVAVLGRDPDKARRAVDQIRAHDDAAIAVTADVRNLPDVEAAIDQVVAALGPLDCVVSGAAGNFLCAAEALSSNGFRAVMDIDLLGTFHIFKAVRSRVRTPASLLAISSGQAYHPMWGQAHASAAKAGIESLVRTLALEWGPAGIRVNSLCPGPIEATEGVSRLLPPERIKSITDRLPMRRFGTQREIAQAAMFLLSSASSFVTGATLHCDGGMTLAPYDGQPGGI